MSIQTLMNPTNGKILPQFIDNAVVTQNSSVVTLPLTSGVTMPANTMFIQQAPLIIPINPLTIVAPTFAITSVIVPTEMQSREYLYLNTELFLNFSSAIGGADNFLSTFTGLCQPAGGVGPYSVIQVPRLNLVNEAGAVSNTVGFLTNYNTLVSATRMIINLSEIYNMNEVVLNHIDWTQPFDIVLFGASTEAIAGGVTVGVNLQSQLNFVKLGP